MVTATPAAVATLLPHLPLPILSRLKFPLVRLHGITSSRRGFFLLQDKTSCFRRYLLLSLLDYICAVGSLLAEGPEPVSRSPSRLLVYEAATVEPCRPRQPKKGTYSILSRSALGVSSIKSPNPPVCLNLLRLALLT